jgi:hypothetical protein
VTDRRSAPRAGQDVIGLLDINNLLSRIVAAQEELALGAVDEAVWILEDLEIDLAGLLGRSA